MCLQLLNCSLIAVYYTQLIKTFFEEIKLPKLTNCHYSVNIPKSCNDRRIFLYSTLNFSKNQSLLCCNSAVLPPEGAFEIEEYFYYVASLTCFLKQNILETSRC